jgi:hypothetical protein
MNHSLVVAKITEGLAVNKQGLNKFHMKRFNLKKLNEVKVKEKCHVEGSNGFAILEDLDGEVEINTLWDTIRKNIKISVKESLGYYEPKQHFISFHFISFHFIVIPQILLALSHRI